MRDGMIYCPSDVVIIWRVSTAACPLLASPDPNRDKNTPAATALPITPATVAKRARQHNTGYLQIFGDFSILNGVARTENFLYEEKGQRLSLVGAFDLNNSRMGTVVGVAPFRRMGRVIEKIPILGPIVTGGKEGSLITTYYKVEGPFSDPKIESVPFKSISEKVLGTLEGIIIAPSDLFIEREPANP